MRCAGLLYISLGPLDFRPEQYAERSIAEAMAGKEEVASGSVPAKARVVRAFSWPLEEAVERPAELIPPDVRGGRRPEGPAGNLGAAAREALALLPGNQSDLPDSPSSSR